MVIEMFMCGYGELKLDVVGPSSWHHTYPTCAGSSQSPVNIDRSKVVFSSSLTTFDIPGYETIPRGAHWQLHNNGRTGELWVTAAKQMSCDSQRPNRWIVNNSGQTGQLWVTPAEQVRYESQRPNRWAVSHSSWTDELWVTAAKQVSYESQWQSRWAMRHSSQTGELWITVAKQVRYESQRPNM